MYCKLIIDAYFRKCVVHEFDGYKPCKYTLYRKQLIKNKVTKNITGKTIKFYIFKLKIRYF